MSAKLNGREIGFRDRLARAGRVIKLSTLCIGGLWWLATGLGVWLGLFLADNLLRLPHALRLLLTAGGATFVLAGFLVRVCFPAARRQRAERTALKLEKQYEVPDNLLINACQLETRELAPNERNFMRRTVTESGFIVKRIPSPALWGLARLRRWSVLATVLVVAWIVYCAALPRQAINAFARYALPLGDIPPAGSFDLRIMPSSDIVVCEGDDLAVRAEAEKDGPGVPVLVWAEGVGYTKPVQTSGENVQMLPIRDAPHVYSYTFRVVRRPFSFRVFAGDTYSRSIQVHVNPLPDIKASLFRVLPPAYTGLPPQESPGPPSSLTALAGSELNVHIELTRRVASAVWQAGGVETPFTPTGDKWAARTSVSVASPYQVEVTAPSLRRPVTVAKGEVDLEADRAPQVDFVTDNRNRFVSPGTVVELDLQAADDFGVRTIHVSARRADPAGNGPQETAGRPLKSWTYVGPPGNPGPMNERVRFEVTPDAFIPGVTYLIEAACHDFRPGSAPGKSRPVVLRIKSWDKLEVPAGDDLAQAFSLLKKTIAEQKQANALTDNLSVHLSEALEGKRLPQHRQAMTDKQRRAEGAGKSALAAFRRHPDGQRTSVPLATLVTHEMSWVLNEIPELEAKRGEAVPARLKNVADRQAYILAELISLLGKLSDKQVADRRNGEKARDDSLPPVTAEDAGKLLRDELDKFTRSQKRVVRASRMLMDRAPDDLTEEEEKILGELAREEAEWAQFFEESLTDFSKLPLQDFADSSVAEEFNEIVQEVKLAAKSLYEKNIEMAVPHEQSGLEKAEELVHNLERWLSDIPDNLKWLMEEPLAPADIPLAELPAELEDIVGDLIDQEEQMSEEVEDVTSSWIDSLDKGAGWDAKDGPISSMGAKGITGNLLPNKHEVGGRSGEGRTGRSHGQMVEETAQGKKGRDTPTRLTPSPFEPGSIEDSSAEGTGGATGGGKLSGFTGEGLRGPAPLPRLESMARLAGQQAAIRQSAEVVALKLRAYHLPTGDLEGSIGAMRNFEDAAARGDGLRVRQSFHHIMDALEEARGVIRSEIGLHRERSSLPDWARSEIMSGLREGTPRGYEEMIAEYFRALAETRQEQGR